VIDDGIHHPWPPPIAEAAAKFLQGHLLECPPLFYVADLRHPIWQTSRVVAEEAGDELGVDFIDLAEDDRPPYGIITTQSCDLAEERDDPLQPWFAVAPVYCVPADAKVLHREYIVALRPPTLVGDGVWVVDLRIEMPLEKGMLVDRMPIEAFPDEPGYISFANLLARRRGRPALASVFHDVIAGTTRALTDENKDYKKLSRKARENIYKLLLAIQDGTRLQPVAAKLYVVTDGQATAETREFFDLWWNDARIVADERGLQLLPTGWLDAQSVDLRLVDDLVEVRSPL